MPTYICNMCDKFEVNCSCEKYCIICKSMEDPRLCSDGCYYCYVCREAMDMAPE